MADEQAWAQRLADLMNDAEAQGFPVIDIRVEGEDLMVSSYGGGVHYADAFVRKVDGRWAVEGEGDIPSA